ncbi:MAG: autotransporter outer membrane beta-barrel domain-containing protein, partial [Endomicrobia bacterium]|nr:autotransporter outer membrane beta-barrel domain-containing protein [Endomicrobiia bacterium]
GFEHYGTATAKYNSVTIDSVTAGAAVGGAAISVSDFADAKNNSITIINSGISGPVWGGFAGGDSAMASSNSITITGSQTGENVIGGYAGLYGDDGSGSFGFFPVPFRAEAYNNSITIVDSIVSSGSIYGGRAYSDASYAYAHNNNVTMTGGTVGDIYGGYADSNHNMASADNNSVTITNITMGAPGYAASVCGGYAYSGYDSVMASNNSVTIDSVTLNGNVSGGYAMLDGSNSGKYASALYNTVTIIGENGGKIVGNIYGGYSPINVYNGEIGIAIHNTVNIVGAGTDLTEAVIFGGFVGNGNNNFDVLTGNTLNITGSDIRVSGIRNFYNYNFYLPETIADGDTMLTALRGDGTDNAVNISNSTVGMGFVGSTAPDINAGDTITLIDTNGNGLTATGINSTAQALLGSITKLYEFDLIVDSNCLYATYTGVNGVNPKMKILSEGVAAGAILAVRTADNINGGLLSGLKGDKVEAIASIFGGKSKYDTGSSVEMSAFGAAAGIAKKFDSGSAGIFVEYANGTFDTEYDGLDGDGSASTIGLGVLAKKDITDNFYVEGLIRVGQLSNDYKSTVSGVSTDFDYDSMYFGASVGAGRIFDVNEKMSVDVFGKYALTNIGESDVKLKTGDKYEFDSILSNSIKAGAKGEYKINDALKPYLVLSYDYELSGDVDAKINGMEIESPTLNGGTFSGGLGVNAKVAEKLTLDLSAQLYTGVREGIIGGLRIKYEF